MAQGSRPRHSSVAQTLACGALSIVVVHLALVDLNAGEAGVGLLNAAIGTGGIAGGLVAVLLAGRLEFGGGLRVGSIVFGVSLALVAVAHTLLAALALLCLAGAGNIVGDVATFTLLQRATPDAVRARVFGTFEGVNALASGTGALLGGAAVELVGARSTVLAVGIALAAVTYALWRPLASLEPANREQAPAGQPAPA